MSDWTTFNRVKNNPSALKMLNCLGLGRSSVNTLVIKPATKIVQPVIKKRENSNHNSTVKHKGPQPQHNSKGS